MTKTQQLNSLFEKWEQHNPVYQGKFVSDGIINEDLFKKAEKKILFIAKEPNDPEPKTKWGFRELWSDEDGFTRSFSYRIAEWALGILSDFPEFDSFCDDRKLLLHALQSISFMNVKKIGGGGTSDFSILKKHVEAEKEYIVREIEIIKPEIIILGLSWSEIRDMIFVDVAWNPSGYNINIAKWNDIKLIDFYHPSNRFAKAAVYSLLQNVVQSNMFKILYE